MNKSLLVAKYISIPIYRVVPMHEYNSGIFVPVWPVRLFNMEIEIYVHRFRDGSKNSITYVGVPLQIVLSD